MEIKNKLVEIIIKREGLFIEDDVALEKCWAEEIELLSQDLNDTMCCLDQLEPQYYCYVAEIFDDLSEFFKSEKLIECMKRNAKRTGVNCDTDIEFAIEAMKN